MTSATHSGSVHHAQVGTPGTYSFGILLRQHLRNLRDVTEILRHPRGEQLAKCNRAELGMLPFECELRLGQARRYQPGEASSAHLSKLGEQLPDRCCSIRVDVG